MEVLNMAAAAPDTWTLAEAKSKFSEVIEKARHQGPQTITRRGRSAVVVVDAEAWERATLREARGSFADFLLASPLRGSDLKAPRLKSGVREIGL
jgi:prevent-host-death family protein